MNSKLLNSAGAHRVPVLAVTVVGLWILKSLAEKMLEDDNLGMKVAGAVVVVLFVLVLLCALLFYFYALRFLPSSEQERIFGDMVKMIAAAHQEKVSELTEDWKPGPPECKDGADQPG